MLTLIVFVALCGIAALEPWNSKNYFWNTASMPLTGVLVALLGLGVCKHLLATNWVSMAWAIWRWL